MRPSMKTTVYVTHQNLSCSGLMITQYLLKNTTLILLEKILLKWKKKKLQSIKLNRSRTAKPSEMANLRIHKTKELNRELMTKIATEPTFSITEYWPTQGKHRKNGNGNDQSAASQRNNAASTPESPSKAYEGNSWPNEATNQL